MINKLIAPIFALLALIALSHCSAPYAEAKTRESKKIAACSKEDIKLAINEHNKKFPKYIDTCASDAWGNASKTTACLKNKYYPKLSDACASCFGEMASCSASHCKFKCIGNHFSNKCLKCVDENCPGLSKCTGIAPDKLPPKKPG